MRTTDGPAFKSPKLGADAWRPARVSCLLGLVTALSFATLRGSQSPTPKPDGSASSETRKSARGEASSSNTRGIRVGVEVVNVPVSVLDKRGLPVIDLTQGDFEVYEDGRSQTIKFFGHEPPLP